MLAVSHLTTSVPTEWPLSPRPSRVTPRCNCSSKPPGVRTSSRVFAFVSAPADTFANTSFLARSYLRQQASTSVPWPLPLPPCFLHAFRILIHAALPSIVCRVLLSGGRTTRAPVYPPHPHATSPSQLVVQSPRRPGQTGRQSVGTQLDRLAHPHPAPPVTCRHCPLPPRLRPRPAIQPVTRQPPRGGECGPTMRTAMRIVTNMPCWLPLCVYVRVCACTLA